MTCYQPVFLDNREKCFSLDLILGISIAHFHSSLIYISHRTKCHFQTIPARKTDLELHIMAKSNVMENIVPDHIQLSKTICQELTDMADEIIAETLHTYEAFVANGRQLPSDQWKHAKSKEKVRVFRSRRGKSQKIVHETKLSRPRLLSAEELEENQQKAAACGRLYAYDNPILGNNCSVASHTASVGSFTLFEDSVLAKVKPLHIPLIIATGEIVGSLEDVAYGGLANTEHAWIVRNSYCHNDFFDDRKVLAVLQSPSKEDPFRSVTIKWGTADFNALTTRRDVVYIESQGMAFDSDGERIFYYVIHSIELDDCPPLDLSHNIIRIQLSIAYVARKFNDSTVEMFGRGFVDPRGDMVESYGIMLLANNISASASVVECATMKKLSYLMMQRRRSDASGINDTRDCDVCHKSLSKLGSLLKSPNGCPVCRRVTCNKCSVQKKLTIEVTTEVTQKSFTFCLPCVLEAKEMSAWKVAIDDLRT
ncbi:Zinc finger, RING/FYVE/PHD-type [Plasmopara halstedii]|uniref:Zinc finger, RING/FYVE/PHD-type n=1 Tax=Plasmopara halstedii TaxID=4781 RepID=A0A0P1A9S2_PLAHL|nr:Zinc finger, RING/FYVE/PHD-type [Plasmopara halstedii]CEG37078.1 Zinc finger, RING/FYVE/PHD-type [Plasmopara halstedii]|eukprot:XP_024573447.1 Zinc finger, RING/FYVE/PHD-type [Plasmopara halstedii]